MRHLVWRTLHLLYILCDGLIFTRVSQVCWPKHARGAQSLKEWQPCFCTQATAPQRHPGRTHSAFPGCPFLREEDMCREVLIVFSAMTAFIPIHMKFWMQQMSSERGQGRNCIVCGMASNGCKIYECVSPLWRACIVIQLSVNATLGTTSKHKWMTIILWSLADLST